MSKNAGEWFTLPSENSAIIFENRPDLFVELQLLLNILSKHLGKNNNTNNQVAYHLLLSIISIIP